MSPCFRLLPLAVVAIATAAAAQTSPVPGRAADTPPATAPPTHRAPLAGYHPFSDEQIVSWQEANDTVGQIGGWRAYARETRPLAAEPPAAPDAVRKAPVPAAGHGDHANH